MNPSTTYQGTVRGRLSVNSAAWRTLTATQRAGWEALGEMMTRTDALGQTVTLTGFQAYCSVNNNNLAAGESVVADAPALVTPSAPTTCTLTLTAATVSLAFTPTPLGAGIRLAVYCSPQRSAGRSYESDIRLLAVSAAAAASPLSLTTAFTGRFGTPVVGNRVFWKAKTFDDGFLSGPLSWSQVVAS